VDLSQIAPTLSREELRTLASLGVRFDAGKKLLTGAVGLSLVSQEGLWQSCAKDPEFFIIDSGLIKTLDNQKKWDCTGCKKIVSIFAGGPCPACRAPMLLRDPIQSWPTHRYGPRRVIRILQREPLVCIAKSRRMMATELMCSYALGLMLFRKGALCVFQSDKEDKANDNVKRVWGMHSRLPGWMRKRRPCNPTTGGGQIENYFEIPNNYAKLVAIPSGPEQIREMGPSFYFCDEAAFHTNAGQTYAAVTQAIEAGCQAVYVSTAAAGFFAGLFNDCLETVA